MVVPLYNHERYVVAALESVFRQSARPREVIVIDDGSSDGSFELVRKTFGDEEGLVLWSKPNGGAHHTINAGIHRATSSNIAILNSDDRYEPERLQRCVELLESHREADVVCTGVAFIDGEGERARHEWYEERRGYYLRSGDLALSLVRGNFLMSTSNFVVRRAAFEKFGYFGKFRYAHDLAFLLRVLARGGEIHVDPRPLLQYRVHDSNTIRSGGHEVKVELAAVLSEYLLNRGHANPDKRKADYFRMLYEASNMHDLSRILSPVMAAVIAGSRGGGGADDLLADAEFVKFISDIERWQAPAIP